MIELYVAVLLFGVGTYLNTMKKTNNSVSNTTNQNNANNTKELFSVKPVSFRGASQSLDAPQQVKMPSPSPSKKVEQKDESKQDPSVVISPLTGKKMSKDAFMTDSDGFKMMPYIRKNATQNMNPEANSHKLALHTGRDPFTIKRKCETKPLFAPTPEITNIHGQKNWTHKIQDRYINSKIRNNELPFEQFQVGRPGLNGKNQKGFQDLSIQEAKQASFKNIDELRVASNPQISYSPPVVSGKAPNANRPMEENVNKNRNTAKGSPMNHDSLGLRSRVSAQSTREQFVAPDKQKKNSRQEFGFAGPTSHVRPRKIALTQESKRNHLKNYGLRNVGLNSRERQMAKLADKARDTKKQNMIGNPRPEGNMNPAIPPKQTAYDPNDIARTTLKEQTIDNNYLAIAKLTEKPKVYDYDTKPKVTIRNTLAQVNTNLNVDVHDKPQAYLLDKAKVTVKEQTEDNTYSSNVKYTKDGGYMIDPAEAPYTNKQFLSDHEYTGIAGNKDKMPTSYGSAYNASLNRNKEIIAKGRKPMGSNVKLVSGGDMENLSHKKQSHGVNTGRYEITQLYSVPVGKESKVISKPRVGLSEEEIRQRIEPDILDAFKNNPFTQSLNSSTSMTCNRPKSLEKPSLTEEELLGFNSTFSSPSSYKKSQNEGISIQCK